MTTLLYPLPYRPSSAELTGLATVTDPLGFELDPDSIESYDRSQLVQVRALIAEREAAYARGDRVELRRIISMLCTFEERFLDMAREGE